MSMVNVRPGPHYKACAALCYRRHRRATPRREFLLMIFRQLFDPQSSNYSHLLGDGEAREAVLIDPVFEQAARDAALVRELGLKLVYTLETHVHADHVTGAATLRSHLGS